jgi:hypothetical protein
LISDPAYCRRSALKLSNLITLPRTIKASMSIAKSRVALSSRSRKSTRASSDCLSMALLPFLPGKASGFMARVKAHANAAQKGEAA